MDVIVGLLVTGFFAEAAVMTLYFRSFDRLARYEFEHHNERWIERGKPAGFSWTPKGASTMSIIFRKAELTAKQWAEDRPEWVWDDISATDLYLSFLHWRTTFRVVSVLFVVVVFATLAINFIISK